MHVLIYHNMGDAVLIHHPGDAYKYVYPDLSQEMHASINWPRRSWRRRPVHERFWMFLRLICMLHACVPVTKFARSFRRRTRRSYVRTSTLHREKKALAANSGPSNRNTYDNETYILKFAYFPTRESSGPIDRRRAAQCIQCRMALSAQSMRNPEPRHPSVARCTSYILRIYVHRKSTHNTPNLIIRPWLDNL